MIMRTHDLELLDDLARTSLDAETAFTVCAHTTRNERLGAMLLARALICGQAARSLAPVLGTHDRKRRRDAESRRNGPDWMTLHDALLAHDDATVRDECVRTEDETLARFRALLECDVPVEIQRLVLGYFAVLLRQYGRLRELELPAGEARPCASPIPVTRPVGISHQV